MTKFVLLAAGIAIGLVLAAAFERTRYCQLIYSDNGTVGGQACISGRH